MNTCWLKKIIQLGWVLMIGVNVSACSGGKQTWREEVLLHDGSKLIVTRSQSYGGRGEIGQSPIKEHTISFTLPNANQPISWTSEYSEDVGRANFNLLALHVLNGTPYLVVEPNLCLSYNKWGRPNPPYVFFKHDGKAWQRIALSELPTGFKTINLIINNGREEDIEKAARKLGHVSVEKVQQLNSSLKEYPQYQTILRESYPTAAGGCTEMIHTNDGWEGLGFFSLQPSFEACLGYCNQKDVSQQNCPCSKLFKGEK